MRGYFLFIAGLACLSVHSARAQNKESVRSEVPIREVVLSDGMRRYTIPIFIGNTAVEAGLDTGSTGLRVLPGVLGAGDFAASGSGDSYSYGSGTQFDGKTGNASVRIGALVASTNLQSIEKASCRNERPRCPASRISAAQFGIQGNGLPGEGFRAIIGVNMAQAEIASPLPAIGAARWIVELPRPGADMPGKLTLNPSDDEVKDFVRLPIVQAYRRQRGGLHDSVKGCILNVGTKAMACGALLMDTGAPGIVVNNSNLGSVPWPNGTAAALMFYGDGPVTATEQFVVGQRSHASRLSFEKDAAPGVAIMSGLSPYFAFDVLYDPGRGGVGLRPRPVSQDSPTGALAGTPAK